MKQLMSVAHEALLREWQRVREWLSENREFLRMRDRLDASLKLWVSRGRQKDDLLRPGLALAEGEKLASDFRSSLSEQQAGYIGASVVERERLKRAQERSRYRVLGGITAALIVAVVFGIVSFRQFRRAERSKGLADRAAESASRARNEAEKLITFMTMDLSDKLKPIGRLDLLNDVNRRIQEYYNAFATSDSRPEILRQRSYVLFKYGDIREDQGDLSAALQSYRNAAATQKKLTEKDPKNIDWQMDLAKSLEKIAEVLNIQGDTDAAMDNYRQFLNTCKSLVNQEPHNSDCQRELSSAYQDIGYILSTRGDWDGSLENYRKSLSIRQELASRDPNNSDAERNLFKCLAGIGYVLEAKGDLQEALKVYQSSLAITRALANRNENDTNTQRDLSIALERVGDVLRSESNLSEALTCYQSVLSIREKLADRDVTNLLWRSDVAWSYQEIGDVLMAQHDVQGARNSFRHSLDLAQQLAKEDPNNREWQGLMAVLSGKLGETLLKNGNLDNALDEFQVSLKMLIALAQEDPTNAQWASSEALAYFEVAITLRQSKGGSELEIEGMLRRAREILLVLKSRSKLDASDEAHLNEINGALANKIDAQ